MLKMVVIENLSWFNYQKRQIRSQLHIKMAIRLSLILLKNVSEELVKLFKRNILKLILIQDSRCLSLKSLLSNNG
ncbi:hypothetical protein AOA57_27855, partial [Pseudomonas sp. 2588-5]